MNRSLLKTFALSASELGKISLLKSRWHAAVNAFHAHLGASRNLSGDSPGSEDLSYVFPCNTFANHIVYKRNESAVVGAISKSIVDSVNSQSGFPLRKSPFEKRLRRLSPFITDSRSFGPIKFKRLVIAVMATLDHLIPNTPKRMFAQAVRSCSQTATTLCFTAHETATKLNASVPALALTLPERFAVLIRSSSLYDSKEAKSLTHQIISFLTHYISPRPWYNEVIL